MKDCHYQDVPRKRCTCLRWLCDEDGAVHRGRTCDEHLESRCPYRAWDVDTRMEVVRRRSTITDGCEGCGGRHDTFAEMYVCICGKRMARAIEENPRAHTSGSREDIFEDVPSMVRTKMWRTLRDAVVDRDDARCQDCGRDLSAMPKWYIEVHHVIPRVVGGGDHPANLKTLCLECHRHYTDCLLQERVREFKARYEDDRPAWMTRR